MKAQKKEPNDIRIGARTRISNVISYCDKLMKENNVKTLNFSAVGGSIGTLVNVIEVLKLTTPGFYQQNRIATISYQSVEEGGDVQNQRLYPKLEVILSLEKIENPTEGYQEPITEEERKKLIDLRDKRRQERGPRRGRRFGPRRGGFRGRRGRGGFRGRRGGFRGRGRPLRGGFRGGRPLRGGRNVRGMRPGARRARRY